MLLGAIIAGFILDLAFGDPHWLPHPICLIGNLIGFLDRKLRPRLAPGEKALLLGGAVLVAIVLALSYLVPFLLLSLAAKASSWLAFALETLMCYQIFATKSLRDESMKVYRALAAGDLADARVKLSWIVGRDTQDLTEEEVIKGAVETVAENTSDGIVAPMIYMFIGGAPLAFLYKGINTMDSMIGYKNDKYLFFGRCAAKLDDLANLVPARAAGILMIAASYLAGLDVQGALRIFLRDRYNHLSPNSAMTESAAAGTLGIQLGGDHFYFGKLVHKDTIGDNLRPAKAEDIVTVNKLLYLAAWLSLAACSLIYGLYFVV